MKSIILIALLLSVSQCWVWYNIDTRHVPNGSSGGDDQEFANNLWGDVSSAEQPDGYCTVEYPEFPLDNSGLCNGPNDNIGTIFQLWWTTAEANQVEFRFGADFGRGAASWTYDDENWWVLQTVRQDDLWWAGNWDSTDVFSVDHWFPAGQNGIGVVGSEGCCDGAMNIQFRLNGGEWLDINQENLHCAFPEPQIYVHARTVELLEEVEGECQDFGWNLEQAVWNAEQPDGYCDISNPQWPISNQSSCGGGATNIGWYIHTEFVLEVEAEVEFEYGVDFGHGSAVFVDWEWQSSNVNDLWWAGDWNSDAIIRVGRWFGPGFHDVDVYGHEGCCDGAQAVRFRINGGEWQPLTVENWQLEAPQKPDPYVWVSTRFSDQATSGEGEDFAYNLENDFWSAEQPSGYCDAYNPTWPLEASNVCGAGGPNSNILWNWTLVWYDDEYSWYELQVGSDFGRGGAVFHNGQWLESRTDDLWWAGNWDSSDVFTTSFESWPGENWLTVYGSEGCCDGANDVRFSRNGSEWQHFSDIDFNAIGKCGATANLLQTSEKVELKKDLSSITDKKAVKQQKKEAKKTSQKKLRRN